MSPWRVTRPEHFSQASGIATAPRDPADLDPGRPICHDPLMSDAPIHLAYEESTLVVTGGTPETLAALPFCKHDARTGVYRAEAHAYRPLVEHLRAAHIPYKDEARAYQLTPWPLRTSRD